MLQFSANHRFSLHQMLCSVAVVPIIMRPMPPPASASAGVFTCIIKRKIYLLIYLCRGQEKLEYIHETFWIDITHLFIQCAEKNLMPVVSFNKLHTYFRQRSYTDCAVHIVCIFGLTGEVFSQTVVGRNFYDTLILK